MDVSWAQELCIYMFIWMAKFGAAYGVRTGIHVGVDVLVNILPASSRRTVITFSLLCGAFFTSVVAAFGASFVAQMWHTGQQSNDLEVPMWIVYLAIPLGSSLMCFRFLQVAWSFYRTGELPHHDAAHIDGVEVDALSADALHPATPREAGGAKDRWSPLGLILILAPILIVAICFAHAGGLIVLPQGLRVAIVFALLLALMLTGMPISIALGLTVLSFMFTLTDVRTESVALKLFHGHRKLRDHGDPVLHSCRQFPDPRWCRPPHDCIRNGDGWSLVWRSCARRRAGLRACLPRFLAHRRQRSSRSDR